MLVLFVSFLAAVSGALPQGSGRGQLNPAAPCTLVGRREVYRCSNMHNNELGCMTSFVVAMSGIQIDLYPCDYDAATGMCSEDKGCPADKGVICNNDCNVATDGICDDGGWNAVGSQCAYGTDCSDCGVRQKPTTPSPSAPNASSCVNQCGMYASAGSGGCSCDEYCDLYNDCCSDYQAVCAGFQSGAVDKNPGFVDSKGDGCKWYEANPAVCPDAWTFHNSDLESAIGSCGVCNKCYNDVNFRDSFGHDCNWYSPDPKVCDAAKVFANAAGDDAGTACCVCNSRIKLSAPLYSNIG